MDPYRGLVPLGSIEQCQELDLIAIKKYKFPGIALMENAASRLCDLSLSMLDSPSSPVHIFCGPGNNGGDGLAVARHLDQRGVAVYVYFTKALTELKGDALVNAKQLKHTTVKVKKITPYNLRSIQLHSGLCIDALLGSGAQGAPKGLIKKVIQKLNTSTLPVLSIDIPSGLNANTSMCSGETIQAKTTLSLGLQKIGCLYSPTREKCGQVHHESLGYPSDAFKTLKLKHFLSTSKYIQACLPKRKSDTHKHRCGKVLVVAGSSGMSGAAHFTAYAAMKSGAGLVVIACPKSIAPILQSQFPEAMVLACEETNTGQLSSASAKQILKKISWADSIALGPGLGRDPETTEVVRDILTQAQCPLALDADALFHGQGLLPLLKKRKAITVITPHRGEYQNLFGDTPPDAGLPLLEHLQEKAQQHKIYIHLKGAPSASAHPKGPIIVNSTGNSGMATGGSGDVLTGIIATLLAQKLDPLDSMACASYLHGKAGDCAEKQFGKRGLIASHLIEYLDTAFKALD